MRILTTRCQQILHTGQIHTFTCKTGVIRDLWLWCNSQNQSLQENLCLSPFQPTVEIH